jgi:hypothetical protein
MFRPSATNTEQANKDRVAGILRESGLSSREAYVNAVCDIVRANGSRFLDVNGILAAARQLNVPADEDREQIWANAFAVAGTHFDTQASRVTVEDFLRKRGWEFNAPHVNAAIQLLGQTGELPLTASANAVQEAANHRQALINTISESGSRTVYPLWSPRHGSFKWLECASLVNEPDDMLEQLARLVPGWRAQISGSRQSESKTSFKDSLGETSSRPQQPVNALILKHPDGLEQEPTRKELIQWLKHEPKKVHSMIYLPGSRQARPGVSQRINEILAGK